MDWAEEDFRNEIQAMKWGWPNKTQRKNGSEADTTRDIVDLGGLLSSQKRENFGQEKTVFTWTGKSANGTEKSYALEVHDGYTAKGGGKMPGRAFTDHAIQQLPDIVRALIAREIKSNG